MIRHSLMRGAAFGALFAIALGASAQAAPAKKHHHHHARTDSGDTQMNAELVAQVNALRAQVQSLEARLDQQATAQQQTAAAAQNAQASASQARSEAQMAEADIKRIPEEVHSEVVKSTPKPGWWGNTQVGGVVFANLSNVEQKLNGASTPPSGTGFDIKRAYIAVDHKFSDVWSADITTDMQYSSAVSATELYLKKAYVQGKFSDAFTLRLGASEMPWIPFSENVYGYRYVEQSLDDRTKFGTSSDWGAHLSGKFVDGMLNYDVAVVDGAGYKAPLRSHSMDVEGRVNLNIDHFVLAVGGYDGKLGKAQVGVATPHTATRFNALAAYTNDRFRIGAEYFDASNWTAVTSVAPDKAHGTSVFGSVVVMPKVSVFARYDWVTPNGDTVPTKRESYYNAGLSWSPTKIVDLALVYKHDNVDHGVMSLGDIGGTPGSAVGSNLGAAGLGNKGTFDEIGLYTQVKW
jgi:hypothetical protein